MKKTSASTRARILTKAKREIARHGFAGARINRIVEETGTSKERLYAYFRDKDALAAAVILEGITSRFRDVPFDADDLPGYVGRLFEFYAQNPEDIRLSYWLALEPRALGTARDARRTVLKKQVDAIKDAQRRKVVDPEWEPLTLLNLLIAIAIAWHIVPDEVRGLGLKRGRGAMKQHKQAAQKAAARLIRR